MRHTASRVASHDWPGINGTATLSSSQHCILSPQTKRPVVSSFWTTRQLRVVSRKMPSWTSRAKNLKAATLSSAEKYVLTSHFEQPGVWIELPSQMSTALFSQPTAAHRLASHKDWVSSPVTVAVNASVWRPPISSVAEEMTSLTVFTGQSLMGSLRNLGLSCQADLSARSLGVAPLVMRSAIFPFVWPISSCRQVQAFWISHIWFAKMSNSRSYPTG